MQVRQNTDKELRERVTRGREGVGVGMASARCSPLNLPNITYHPNIAFTQP